MVDPCEFKANLAYKASPRAASAITQRNLVSIIIIMMINKKRMRTEFSIRLSTNYLFGANTLSLQDELYTSI